ncbi:MAG: hypothetical protein M0Z33_05115 [Actinomycetota bacterium]|nr:hypothetical protein [Actinomycetota bacterium]
MRRIPPTARGAVTAVAAAAVAAAALGGPALGATPAPTASLPAATIVKESEAALTAARTFTLSGTIREASATLTVEVASADGGAEARGVLDSSSASAGFLGRFAYITIRKTSYIRAGAPFWRQAVGTGAGLTAAQAAKAATALANRWIAFGASYGNFGVGTLTDPRSLANGIFANVGSVRKGRPTTVRGVHAIPIVSTKGGTLYVALDGPPLPIELSGTSGGASGHVVFGYPKTVRVNAPTGARTLVQAIALAIG